MNRSWVRFPQVALCRYVIPGPCGPGIFCCRLLAAVLGSSHPDGAVVVDGSTRSTGSSRFCSLRSVDRRIEIDGNGSRIVDNSAPVRACIQFYLRLALSPMIYSPKARTANLKGACHGAEDSDHSC